MDEQRFIPPDTNKPPVLADGPVHDEHPLPVPSGATEPLAVPPGDEAVALPPTVHSPLTAADHAPDPEQPAGPAYHVPAPEAHSAAPAGDIPTKEGSDVQPEPAAVTDIVNVDHTLDVPPPPADIQPADEKHDLVDPGVKDVGWNREPDKLPAPLVRGIPNEELFTLFRRFNKQVWHVKLVRDASPDLLDLEIAEDEEFSPDKLRANLERLYMTVIIGVISFLKHIARLQSWNEPRRTAVFCFAYYLAWWYNLLGTLLTITLLVLVLHPPARTALFPHAPLAAVSSKTGNLQIPPSGTLQSADTLSGAPEAHPGEAVEQEAGNFVAGVASLAVGTATGQGKPPRPGDERTQADEDGVDGMMPDPTQLSVSIGDAKDVAHGGRADKKHDATKEPMEAVLWSQMRPFMRMLSDLCDTWERFGNLLSPTPPFSHAPRLRLAGMISPLLLVTIVVTATMFVKATTFIIGFAFFGQPLIMKGFRELNQRYPNWQKALELRRSILKGVPTNAQLTLTLLRISEANRTPFPPPPNPNVARDPADAPSGKNVRAQLAAHNVAFDTSNYPVDGDDPSEGETIVGEDEHPGPAETPKKGGKLVGIVKRTAKLAVGTALGADHVKASLGSDAAKRRLGAVPAEGLPAKDKDIQGMGEGPTAFSARLHGRKGHVVLVTSAASPFVAFVWDKDLKKAMLPGLTRSSMPGAVFAIALNEIVGLRKIGGFSWRGKLLVGWALEKQIVDGLEIEDREGKKIDLTAIKGRDDLFNRIIAIGDHKWERW